MPQERNNPYPFPTAEEVEAAPGDREIKAARNIASRRFDGIPKRGYVMGDCDHAVIVQGIHDLTTACYKVLDALDGRFEDSSEADALNEMRALLEDHRCPPATVASEDA
jgi:hypothetical protein